MLKVPHFLEEQNCRTEASGESWFATPEKDLDPT
jgi:hypothetical protein